MLSNSSLHILIWRNLQSIQSGDVQTWEKNLEAITRISRGVLDTTLIYKIGSQLALLTLQNKAFLYNCDKSICQCYCHLAPWYSSKKSVTVVRKLKNDCVFLVSLYHLPACIGTETSVCVKRNHGNGIEEEVCTGPNETCYKTTIAKYNKRITLWAF